MTAPRTAQQFDDVVAEVEQLRADVDLLVRQPTAEALKRLRSEVRAYLDVTENPPSHAAWIQARARLEQAVEGGAS